MRRLVALLVTLGGVGTAVGLAMAEPDGIRPVAYHAELATRVATVTRLPAGLASIRFTEEEVTALAREEARRQGYTEVTDLQVACEPGELIASAHYPVAGVQLTVLAHVVPQPAESGVNIKVTSAQVGRLPIPIGFTKYVQDGLDAGITAAGFPGARTRTITEDRGFVTIELTAGVL